MAYLALVRHGKSEWNTLGLWTGWKDIPLNDEGREEAKKAANELKDIHFDVAFTSKLSRAKETLEIIKRNLNLESILTTENVSLNERDYGDFTGKNKWDIKKEVGEEQFQKIRRGYDVPLPKGETLKNVYERTVPYFEQYILPLLKEGKNVLISAHGNSLRALVKYLDSISDTDIEKLEIATGEIYLYSIEPDGTVSKKEIRASHPNTV